MMLDSIYVKLGEIMRNVFDDEHLVARPELTANDVDGWDSFAHLRLIASVEKEFSLRFSASQISSLKNVGDLARLIEARLPAAT
jgi:acyl carrier protein